MNGAERFDATDVQSTNAHPPSVDPVKHLEFVQAVIARQAGNSFLLKGWSVTLAAALVALGTNAANAGIAAAGLIPAAVFWGLDAYYLRQERLFRPLYDAGRLGHAEPFVMVTNGYAPGVANWPATLITPVVLGFHGAVILGIVLAVLLI